MFNITFNIFYNTGRFSQSLIPRHNLSIKHQEGLTANPYFYRYSLMIRKISILNECGSFKDAKQKVQFIISNIKLYKTIRCNLQSIPRNLKTQSSSILKVWARQCECVVAQRLRRGQQMLSLYRRLWEEKALTEFLHHFRQNIQKRSKELILGSIGIGAFNWEANRIPDDIIQEHISAFEYVYMLKEKTVCHECVGNEKVDNLSRCKCATFDGSVIHSVDNWTLFIKDRDLIVWRRPLSPGLYEYKVYGCYNDVTAEDFLNVQVDTDYRRTWDVTAVVLEVVESDPEDPRSDVLYWEMLWPSVFSNRDYVFTRKYIIDHASETILVASKSTQHPHRPQIHNKKRVDDYYSYMVIKSNEGLKQPGIQFVLTYFDNPGVNIPSSVTTWVAYRAMPDYLERLRQASKRYKDYCSETGVSQFCSIIPPPPSETPGNNGNDRGEGYSGVYKSSANPDITPAEILTSPSQMVRAEAQTSWKHLRSEFYFS